MNHHRLKIVFKISK